MPLTNSPQFTLATIFGRSLQKKKRTTHVDKEINNEKISG